VALAAAAASMTAAEAGDSHDPARLSRDVVPTFEAIRLDLDAGKKGYAGSVTIDLKVESPTDSFRLHARDLTITRVALMRGGAVVPTTTGSGDIGLLAVRTSKPLARGACRLEIDFTKDFDVRANNVYRVETGGRSYVFSDFEPDDARRAFPCWDEPSFKIPWQITMTIPKDHRGFSNTLPEKETVVGEKRTVVFHRTVPLSSYLIAIIAGPFETAPIPGLSVPGRIVATHGGAALATQAARETPAILAALERYFDRKYPYDKLDLIAVPEFSAGAMENAAAITFRDNALLLDPKTMNPAQRRRMIGTTAHEISHMWFGDLVTMAWWDDLWLNESFASWMGDKITQQVAPEFQTDVDQVNDGFRAMVVDARLTTRAVRPPLLATHNLSQIFDVISYQKGESVLGMLERWLGPEKIRDGVRAYIAAHAEGNATAADLWASLSKAAGHDVSSVATSFIDQPGVPLVTLEPLGGSRVRLAQRRFLNYGLVEPGRALWKIPVTLHYPSGGREVTQHVLLADSTRTVELEGGATPAWIHPNSEERGYYRWSVPTAMLMEMANDGPRHLSTRERVGFVGNLRALLDAGQVHGDQFLGVLARFADDPDPLVVTAVLTGLTAMRYPFVTPDTRGPFAAYLRHTLWPALERIGMEPRRGEPQTVTLLRPQLMTWLGDDGRDPRVLERARAMAVAYMKDPATLDPSLQDAAISLAALQGDATLFEEYRKRFESTPIPAERARYLVGLANFGDDALVERALRYAREGPLRPQEIMAIANAMGVKPELRDRVFFWTLENYDYIASHIPPSSVVYLPAQATGCSLERAAKARAFFSTAAHSPVGTAKEVEKMEAATRDCVSLREREYGAVTRYLGQLANLK